MMCEEVWRKPRVLNAIGMGNTWLYESVSRGKFPKPVKLGERAIGWRKSDVIGWLDSLEPSVARGSDELGGQSHD